VNLCHPGVAGWSGAVGGAAGGWSGGGLAGWSGAAGAGFLGCSSDVGGAVTGWSGVAGAGFFGCSCAVGGGVDGWSTAAGGGFMGCSGPGVCANTVIDTTNRPSPPRIITFRKDFIESVNIICNLPKNTYHKGKCFAKPFVARNLLKDIRVFEEIVSVHGHEVWPFTTSLVEFGHRLQHVHGGLQPPGAKERDCKSNS